MLSLRDQFLFALEEDVPFGDVTSTVCVPESCLGEAVVTANEPGIFCGQQVAELLPALIHPPVQVRYCSADGSAIAAGNDLLRLAGPLRSILAIERVLLNYLQRLCGIATRTRQYVDALGNPAIAVMDTRKTTPLMRELERQAVAAGGGVNHRFNLSDMVLIKDNHLQALAAQGKSAELGPLLREFKQRVPGIAVEVEVDTLTQLQNLDLTGADIIMFDNFDIAAIQPAVEICKSRGFHAKIEVSGTIRLETIGQYRDLPIDRISIGRLTHSAPALDMSLHTL